MGISGLKAWFANHMPTVQQLASVYGVIVLIVYGWTIYWFAWQLPSWLYFLTLGEILSVFSYAMVVNFIESLITLFVPVLICLLLPPRWFRDRFAALGTSLVVLSLMALMKNVEMIIALQGFSPGLGFSVLLVIVGIVFLVFLISKISLFLKVIEEIANRAIIFLYISLPISALSFLVVLIRNISEAFHG
jgi:hypothetical protein